MKNNSFTDGIPVFIILRAMGILSDVEIMDLICSYSDQSIDTNGHPLALYQTCPCRKCLNQWTSPPQRYLVSRLKISLNFEGFQQSYQTSTSIEGSRSLITFAKCVSKWPSWPQTDTSLKIFVVTCSLTFEFNAHFQKPCPLPRNSLLKAFFRQWCYGYGYGSAAATAPASATAVSASLSKDFFQVNFRAKYLQRHHSIFTKWISVPILSNWTLF